jgi:hypothetical protein
MAASGLGKDTSNVYRLTRVPGSWEIVFGTCTGIVGNPSRAICFPTRSVGFGIAPGQVGAEPGPSGKDEECS